MKMRLSRLLLLPFLLVVLTSGCSRSPGPTAPSAGKQASVPVSSATSSSVQPLSARMLPFAKRKAAMPKGMPIEIPVIDGDVVSTSAPVPDWTWLYTIETTGPVEPVASWYSRALTSVGWELAESGDADGGRRLKLRKGAAETELTVVPAGAGRVRVHVAIGVGRPAPGVN